MLAAQAISGDYQQAIPAAAAIELAHGFSLIHDDIQDNSPQRHHRPTVWWVWGPSQAINAGDSMYALARLAVMRLADRGIPTDKVIRAAVTLDRACLRLCEGQYLDITYQSMKQLGIDAYLKMAESKTSSLISCAIELGALLATDDERVISAFAGAGVKLGLAHQVKDDLLDLWGVEGMGKTHALDVLEKKKSLPIIYGFDKAQGEDKAFLEAVYYRKKVVDDGDIEEFIKTLEKVGAREYAEKTARGFLDEALSILGGTGIQSEGMGELAEVFRYLGTREA